jgi:hypothetical protein
MDYFLKKKREKIESEAEALFGNDTLLKTAFVMSKMEYSKDETEQVIQLLKKENEEIVAEIESRMQYRFDASGNIVPVKLEEEDTIEIKISE